MYHIHMTPSVDDQNPAPPWQSSGPHSSVRWPQGPRPVPAAETHGGTTPASRPWAGGAKFWNTAGVSQDGTIVPVCGTISLEGGH